MWTDESGEAWHLWKRSETVCGDGTLQVEGVVMWMDECKETFKM